MLEKQDTGVVWCKPFSGALCPVFEHEVKGKYKHWQGNKNNLHLVLPDLHDAYMQTWVVYVVFAA